MERRVPTVNVLSSTLGGKDDMKKASINLQDLRRKIYYKAKAEKTWRFWGIYVHVCKKETLLRAYQLAKKKNGAPGVDGVTFEEIEESGREGFIERIQCELKTGTYRPMRNRSKEIPKGRGKVRVLGIPSVRDRVVQGALKLILEPIFEADFQDGSYGYRPKRTPHQAIDRVAMAVVSEKTQVIDVDLKCFFDNVRHDILLKKVAERVADDRVMRLIKLILKISGKRGVPQGGVISPLLANLYLNEVDKMLEKAKEVTREGRFEHIEYVRFADDIVILVDSFRKWKWLEKAAYKRLLEELGKLKVQLNQEKTREVNLHEGGTFNFLGFNFRRARTRKGKWGVRIMPTMEARTALTKKLKEIFRRHQSQPVERIIYLINPILRGWVNYFRIGHSSRRLGYIKDWVEKKVRRHLMRVRKLHGFGWKKWSKVLIYHNLGLYNDYRVRYYKDLKATSS